MLSVTVERHRGDTGEATWTVRERPTGRHTRQIHLGDTGDFGVIDASYDDGVLTVSMPMSEETEPRKVGINRTSRLLEGSGV